MNKMKKSCFALVLPLLLGAGFLSACQPDKYADMQVIKVWNFHGGFGNQWYKNLVKEYEELHKDTVYGDKTGVHFETVHEKQTFDTGRLVTYDMFFLELGNYVDYVVNNDIEDITEAVLGDNPYETGKSIYSKMTDAQKEFYNRSGKYYAVPHYSGTYGVTYDAKLFKDKRFFFKKGHPAITDYNAVTSTYFTGDLNNLADGPDGVAGTDDDGLPATFEEFYALCCQIKKAELSPFEFAGETEVKRSYLTYFTSCLMNSIMGGDQALINYSFNGTLQNPVEMEENAGVYTVKLDANNKPVISETPITITEDNGYEVFKSEGRYQAAKFVSEIFKNAWYNPKCSGSGHTYTTAESDFIQGEMMAEDNADINRCAMLIDGTWWSSESQSIFELMEKAYPEDNQSINERQFKFMPLPTVDSQHTYHKTWTDVLNAIQVVRKGVSGYTKQICMDFLQFANTDDQLVKFSTTTNSTRALKYDVPASELEKMSPFGRSIISYKHSSDCEIIYPISDSAKFINSYTANFVPNVNFRSAGKNYVVEWLEPYPTNNLSQLVDSSIVASQLAGANYQYFKNIWATL